MSGDKTPSRPVPIPSGRVGRALRLGGMAAGIAGNMALGALGEAGRGSRPEMRRLLMTPGNLSRVASELARMRGAAMKMGQLISMDSGEVLPPELAEILARLRDQADFMPPKQLRDVLDGQWGPGWRRAFQSFDVRPVAAASIGQVHRGQLHDGREVAIKVQYPGVARSIDSDVTNVGTLLKLSGLLPQGFELAPYLAEARRQLHEETDYAREGAQMRRFSELLADAPGFVLPEWHEDWSTPRVLCMSWLAGQPIETVAEAPRAERDRVAAALIDLSLREIFQFGLTQSDPNFANYRYQPETGRIVLLDFGAARSLDAEVVSQGRALLKAGLEDDPDAILSALVALGIAATGDRFGPDITGMVRRLFDALRGPEPYDFADRDLRDRLRADGIALAEAGYCPPEPPMDVLYLQRKLGGMSLLATRLGAVLPLRDRLAACVASAEP